MSAINGVRLHLATLAFGVISISPSYRQLVSPRYWLGQRWRPYIWRQSSTTGARNDSRLSRGNSRLIYPTPSTSAFPEYFRLGSSDSYHLLLSWKSSPCRISPIHLNFHHPSFLTLFSTVSLPSSQTLS